MRAFNFSPGPAVLPEPVLERAAAEMLDWHGSGMSVMEMSHRGKEFISIAAKAEADFRSLLDIPSNYTVEVIAGAGFDWILLDTEHSPNDLESVVTQLQAAAAYPPTAIVRVPWSDHDIPVVEGMWCDMKADTAVPRMDTARIERWCAASPMGEPAAGVVIRGAVNVPSPWPR